MITAIHKHVARLRVDRQQMKDNDLKSILSNVCDSFRKHGAVNNVLIAHDSLKAMQFFCKHMIDSEVYRNILRFQIIDHEIFSLMENTIFSILQKDKQLTDQDWGPFHTMALLLTSSVPLQQFEDDKVNKLVVKTFFSERFLNAIKQCMESTLLVNDQNKETKYRILSYVFRHVYFHSKTYKTKLRSLFLDAAIRCIVSDGYTEQFSKNDEASTEFLLFDCPCFVHSNSADRHDDLTKLLCQTLLKDYQKILSYRGHRKHSDGQRNDYLNWYLKLLNYCATNESTRDIFTHYLPTIITQLFVTMKDYLILEDEKVITSIKDGDLIATILTLLYNLMANTTIYTAIKENAPIPILLLLNAKEQLQMTTNSERKKFIIPKNIQSTAQSLLALITDDIDQLDQPEEVTRASLTWLAKAAKNDSHMYAGVHAGSVLTNISTLAQNDQVKEQIIEQGALRLLSDCVCDPIIAIDQIREPALDTVWTVSFNDKACSVWKTDPTLVMQLQEIYKSYKVKEQKAANAILWRLSNEEKFRAEQSNIQRMLVSSSGQIQSTINKDDTVWVKVNSTVGQIVVLRENLTKEQSDMINVEREQTANFQKKISQPYKYDIMISYSHKNADVCTIIYNCLLKMGKYRIWFDKEEMHGSTMERMAEGIEESHLMLVCMSSTYRTSKQCRHECEYAYKMNHNVLFLKVEANYKPNRWLGFFLGEHYYIDVTKHNFLTTFKDIIRQISTKRNETPDYSSIDTTVTHEVQTAFANALQSKCKRKSDYPETKINDVPTTSTASSQNMLSFGGFIPFETKEASNNEKKIVSESISPEKLTKYYPSQYDYGHVSNEYDSLNDITITIPTSRLLSLSIDGDGIDSESSGFNPDLLSLMLPQMNEDSISVSELSLSTNTISTSASQTISITNTSYQTKPVTEWTREDVLHFLKDKNLTHMSVLLNDQEVNGKHLLEFCPMSKPAPTGIAGPATSISSTDYERLVSELKKLLPSSTNNNM